MATLTAVVSLLSGVIAASPAQAALTDFGFESVSAAETTSQAGDYPDLTTAFDLNGDPSEPDAFGKPLPWGQLRDLSVELPPGFAGIPSNFPTCDAQQLSTIIVNLGFGTGKCPADAQVGVTRVGLWNQAAHPPGFPEPVYNMPSPGGDVVARLGFVAVLYPVFIDVKIRSGSDYGLTAQVVHAPADAHLTGATTTLWGVPADSSHDPERFSPVEAILCSGPCEGLNQSGLTEAPFMTNPTRCSGPQLVEFAADSHPLPDRIVTVDASLPEITGCEKVVFDPTLSVTPTSHEAGAPTGLDADLKIPQSETPKALATSDLRDATVTLPEGMTISPSAADGLDACSAAQVGFEQEGASNCPEAAKLGSATFTSPALEQAVQGEIYQRTPEPGHLFRIWLVADDLGVHLKIPGEVKPDPHTGRLTTVFADAPQLPVEEIVLHFKGGARAPLKNPDSCGTFQTHYVLAPWSGNPPAVGDAPMTIDEGCAGGGFDPSLDAGTGNPVAGRHAPFVASVKREDGEQNVTGLDISPPPGELAKLAGVPVCPDGQAAAGSCPPGSQIGSVDVAVGSGSLPLWLPRSDKEPTAIYLGGPYKGAPYSLIVKVPAQAGPFDLGTVMVRAGIHVDEESARVTVESDPLPQILEGVPIRYRTIHVDIDKPNFTLNPTNCETMAVASSITSDEGATASPRSRFQVGGCGELGFKPKLSLKLMGKTNRGAHPALRATLKMPKHGANIGRAVVALPHSEFLDQGHIKTICTRVQFSAEECPAGSVYGHARAVTPLLDQPLEGPVYLRSSSHTLPDLVADLRGQIHVVLDGRIDSIKSGGIRTTFAQVPDAPVSKFTLTMQGGAKGLLNNSEGLCARTHRAIANFTGQNGKAHDFRPVLHANCHK
jgi:hypothetical protein